jgi:hypothetical protein
MTRIFLVVPEIGILLDLPHIIPLPSSFPLVFKFLLTEPFTQPLIFNIKIPLQGLMFGKRKFSDTTS